MLTAHYGKLGAKFGKKGGRPKIKEGLTDSEHLHGQEYGMDEVEFILYTLGVLVMVICIKNLKWCIVTVVSGYWFWMALSCQLIIFVVVGFAAKKTPPRLPKKPPPRLGGGFFAGGGFLGITGGGVSQI